MIIQSNPQLQSEILQYISKEYMKPRTYPHLVQFIYCLTRTYMDLKNPENTTPTEKELLQFSSGFGFERVFLSKESAVKPLQLDGIMVSPDFLSTSCGLAELKSTRGSLKKYDEEGFPETWIEQIMGYCKVAGILEYNLAVFFLIPAILVGKRLIFTQGEVDTNWNRVLERKVILEKHLTENTMPLPFTYCKDWECTNCRWKLFCDTEYMKEGKK